MTAAFTGATEVTASASSTVAPRTRVDLSIIVPTYNEAGNIPELLRRISRVVTERLIPCEVLVVDDGSPDGTAEAARNVDVPVVVRVIERDGDRGLSPAVIDGISAARGEFVLVMDADLQHPPEALPDLLAAARQGADFVIGSRYAPGGRSQEFGLYRQLNSKIATWLALPLVGRQVRDPMAGLFCFRRDLVAGQALSPVGYKIGLEILVKCRPESVVEVPITFASRHAGDSKMDLAQQVEYVRHLRRLYGWRWPTASQAGLFCAVGTCGMIVDLTLMTLLVALGVVFPVARIGSILTAMVSNFLLNRRITFPDSRQGRKRSQFVRFAAVCSLGLVINWSISNSLYALLPAWRPYYQLFCVAGIMAATLSNFILSKHVAFRMPSTGTTTACDA